MDVLEGNLLVIDGRIFVIYPDGRIFSTMWFPACTSHKTSCKQSGLREARLRLGPGLKLCGLDSLKACRYRTLYLYQWNEAIRVGMLRVSWCSVEWQRACSFLGLNHSVM